MQRVTYFQGLRRKAEAAGRIIYKVRNLDSREIVYEADSADDLEIKRYAREYMFYKVERHLMALSENQKA
jgi:hypothetical protein